MQDGPQPSDSDLLASILREDETALQLLIDRYWAALFRYAARSLASDDAKDVAQEVFIRVWESRKSWEPTGTVKAYLYRIARNLILGRIRHQVVVDRTANDLEASYVKALSPLASAADQEFRSALMRALDALPQRRREALILVRLEGFSLEEAAELMDLSRQTVSNHITLAMQDLAKSLVNYRP